MNRLISIVTPCLNRVGMIADAVESVIAQGYDRFEHIVIDGGSTDGTLDILKRYPHVTVISEPDGGIYDALNKGIALAKGDVVGHLNSDDVYEPTTFRAVAAAFAADELLDQVSGGAVICDGTRLVRDCTGPGCSRLDYATALLGVPIINARFFTSAFYRRVGPYSLDYRLAADRDFLVRAIRAGCRWRAIDQRFYRYRMHAGSATCTVDRPARQRFIQENAALAEAWLARRDCDGDLTRAARLLYGNSLARLAWLSLRDGDASDAFRRLLTKGGVPSLSPLLAATRSVAAHLLTRHVA